MESMGLCLFAGSIFLFMYHHRRGIKEEPHNKMIGNCKKKLNPLWNENVSFDSLFHPAKAAIVNLNISTVLLLDNMGQNQEDQQEEENIWKQRILLQNTPNGNIAMYYDLYRQAFAYHADGHISYSILNKCAMKYVRVFYCRDFFVDTTVLPVDFVSPFNKMKEDEEMKQKLKASEKRKELKLNFDSSAFVVNKKPKTVTYKDETSSSVSSSSKEIANVYKNNFRYIGKISGDLNFLQKISPAKKLEPPPQPSLPPTKTIVDDYDLINNNSKKKNSTYSLWKTTLSK